MSAPRILLTGATGYIASHTWLALLAAGFDVVGIDNFSNSSPEVLNRLQTLGGREPVFERGRRPRRGRARARVRAPARSTPSCTSPRCKAVGEIDREAARLLRQQRRRPARRCARRWRAHGCKALVFSSSATVYGKPERLPIREDAPLSATNPYGATKLMGEDILRDLRRADPAWAIALLRYFNPVGAHESGLIGEDPRGTPNNLMPYVAQVAVGKRPTPAGLRQRLRHARRHRRARLHPRRRPRRRPCRRAALPAGHRSGSITVNLGTGRGYSVLEVVRAFERASGRPVPYEIVARRPGDVAACYADPTPRTPLARLGGAPRPRRDVRRQLALAEDEPERLFQRRLRHEPDPRPSGDHGRRQRHPAVAAVARAVPEAVPGAARQPQPVPAGGARACRRCGRRHRGRGAVHRRQRGTPLPDARPAARAHAAGHRDRCSSRRAATPRRR